MTKSKPVLDYIFCRRIAVMYTLHSTANLHPGNNENLKFWAACNTSRCCADQDRNCCWRTRGRGSCTEGVELFYLLTGPKTPLPATPVDTALPFAVLYKVKLLWNRGESCLNRVHRSVPHLCVRVRGWARASFTFFVLQIWGINGRAHGWRT